MLVNSIFSFRFQNVFKIPVFMDCSYLGLCGEGLSISYISEVYPWSFTTTTLKFNRPISSVGRA